MRTDRRRLVNLVTLVVLTAGLSAVLQGGAFWIGALLVSVTTAYGAYVLHSQSQPSRVPLESVITPAASAFIATGLAHGLPLPFGPVAGLAVGAVLLVVTVELEGRLLGPADESVAHLRQQLVLLTVALAFLGFAAATAVLQQSFIAAEEGTGTPDAGAALVLADAAIAFALGYRLAAVRSTTINDAVREAGTFAFVVAVAAAAIRAISLPPLLAPALLAAVFYLWSGYRSASRAERRSNAWMREYAALAGAALLAVLGNLLLR